jgi:hypothetical protein
MSTIEELLERKSSGSGLENREYDRGDPLRWLCDILYRKTLALTSPTCGGRSVGLVHSRTKAMEFCLWVIYCRVRGSSFSSWLRISDASTVSLDGSGIITFLIWTVETNELTLWTTLCVRTSHGAEGLFRLHTYEQVQCLLKVRFLKAVKCKYSSAVRGYTALAEIKFWLCLRKQPWKPIFQSHSWLIGEIKRITLYVQRRSSQLRYTWPLLVCSSCCMSLTAPAVVYSVVSNTSHPDNYCISWTFAKTKSVKFTKLRLGYTAGSGEPQRTGMSPWTVGQRGCQDMICCTESSKWTIASFYSTWTVCYVT